MVYYVYFSAMKVVMATKIEKEVKDWFDKQANLTNTSSSRIMRKVLIDYKAKQQKK